MADPDHQSPTLMALVQAGAAGLDPPLAIAGLGKTEALSRIAAQAGGQAVFAAGRGARALGWHPVVQALTAIGDPASILSCWRRLERFGHVRNRTEVVASRPGVAGHAIVLRHRSIDARPTAAVDDLFIWGVLVGLLEAAAVQVRRASLHADGSGCLLAGRSLPDVGTHTLHLRCLPVPLPPPVPVDHSVGTASRLRELLARSPVRDWTLAEASRSLAMGARSVQRALRQEGTTFSCLLQRVRLETARGLLADERLSLAEIAYCAGFSDQAHFARLWRRHFDVPPSEQRALLRAVSHS